MSDPEQLYGQLRQTILDGDLERAEALARQVVADGEDLAACLDRGFVAGLREVGRLWDEGEYFLPELVQGADAMKAALAVVRPAMLETLGEEAAGPGGEKVVLGTVAGDIHDIGKTLVATVLEAHGYQVVDLGRDVPDERFVEAVAVEQPRLLGLSALLTTTMLGQRRVVDLLRERGLRDRVFVLVGGAPVTPAFAEEIGADGYAGDAMGALNEARRLLARGAE